MKAQVAALLAILGCLLPVEWSNWTDLRDQGADWMVVLVTLNWETWLLVLLPYFWLIRQPWWSPRGEMWQALTRWWHEAPPSGIARDSAASTAAPNRRFQRGTAIALVLIAATSLGVSIRVSAHRVGEQRQYRFGRLPPTYHDEFSYLFQAQTYLAGRWANPSPPAARLFDQMHVVNEECFASRYFPATGLFVAPWLWLGCPIVGHWLAGAVTCLLVFGIGRELSNNGTGLIAGMLTALSPGMGLFSNLILAHHPTLLGLFFFAWSFLRWQRHGRLRLIVLAGIGLSWAMLCRPMTAAGFALPFGIWFGWKLLRSFLPNGSDQTVGNIRHATLGLAIPLLIGFAVLAAHNQAITGDWRKTPYQLFTEIYTPRHVYGFNNVVRGEQHLGPRVLENYDRWAENLTPALALTNTKNRLLASWQWTLGLLPSVGAAVLFVLTGSDRDQRWWLIGAAIVSLFAVHIPYWFDGIFHWHYVFETGPLWCLIVAAAITTLGREWSRPNSPRTRMPIWLGLFLAVSVLGNHVDFTDSPSKLLAGADQLAFSRLKYQAFDELLARRVVPGALVLIVADPADRHIDYVYNEPTLTAPILRGRYPVTDWPLHRIAAAFQDRRIFLFDAKTGSLRRATED